jgi:hypothetical protein
MYGMKPNQEQPPMATAKPKSAKAAVRAASPALPKPGTKYWKNYAEWANAEFAACSAEDLARFKPPSGEEWDQMKNPYLVSLRIAYRMAELDKPAHIAALNALTTESKAELFDSLEKCGDRFRRFADLADEALERLLCAGAKIKLESMEARS